MSTIVKLPKAPNEYNINDQDFVRKRVAALLTLLSAATGGTGAPTRQTVSKTTGSLANNAEETGSIDFGSSMSGLLLITSNKAARIRLYATSSARTADAGRIEGTDPLPGSGTLAEFIFLASGTIYCGPPPILYNGDGPSGNIIYYAIKNKSGSTGTVTVDLVHVDLET